MRQQYLKGEEIFLSPTEESDIEILWKIKSSEFARKYMSSSLPKTKEDVSKEVKAIQENGSVFFSILTHKDQKVIGYVCLEIVSNVIRAAEMHICISEVHSGKGYGKEVVSLMTDYAFEELNIHSIRAMIRENNQRSVRCFQSQGYHLIGTLPEWSFYNGKYNDCHILDCIPRFRKEQVLIRKAKKEDFQDVVDLSENILRQLKLSGKSDFFGGVDKEEIQSASHVLVAVRDKQIVGFLLLEEPTEEIAEKYESEFNKDDIISSLILNGYGIRPYNQRKGISKMLLEEAKKIAIKAGKRGFIGTIHPENLPSGESIEYISKSIFFGNEFIHKTKDGRQLKRKRFLATF